MKKMHGEISDDSITCEKCGKNFVNLKACKLHAKKVHPTAQDLAKVSCDCEKCDKVFSNADELNKHLKECLENPPKYM